MSKALVKKEETVQSTMDISYHSSLRKWIVMDVGTANLRMLSPGKEKLSVIPCVAAVNQNTGKLLQYGTSAQQMHGRTPEHISVLRPFCQSSVPADVVGEMIRHFLFTQTQKTFLSPYTLLSVPTGSTADMKQEWMRQAKEAGSHRVSVVEPIYAAALGAGWDPDSTKGFMIVDIGGSMSSIAVLSLGTLACSRLLPIGGDQFDQSIMRYLRKKYEILLKPETAELLKRNIGTVYDKTEETFAEVRGRCVQKGTPKLITVGSGEMIEAMTEPVTAIVDAICSLVEQLPESLLEDILYSGMVLTGGGSQLYGLDRLITRVTGIPTRVAEDPENATVRGLARLMDKRSTVKSFPIKWY